ncbi:hypothetical protein H0X10_04585 [Candidatus Saccharibacteria bacterium]|nr:hypothetical protein [Candidatus Saccharibacteria bacterium]
MMMKAYRLSAKYIQELETTLTEAEISKEKLFQAVVNSPFNTLASGAPLGLGIIVLLLVNSQTETIDRIALSDTEHAKGALDYSVKKFREIQIPLTNEANVIAKAIHSGKYQVTSDWHDLFVPALTAEEARFNQAGAGIGCSVIYPLTDIQDRGAIIYSYYVQPENITSEHHAFMKKYAELATGSLNRCNV